MWHTACFWVRSPDRPIRQQPPGAEGHPMRPSVLTTIATKPDPKPANRPLGAGPAPSAATRLTHPVLLVEDNPVDAMRIRQLLARASTARFEVASVATLADAQTRGRRRRGRDPSRPRSPRQPGARHLRRAGGRRPGRSRHRAPPSGRRSVRLRGRTARGSLIEPSMPSRLVRTTSRGTPWPLVTRRPWTPPARRSTRTLPDP